jgi:hypothetical protein
MTPLLRQLFESDFERYSNKKPTSMLSMPEQGLVDIGDQPVPAATTVHRGQPGHDVIGSLYAQLARWTEDHGYSVRGPGRDLMIGPHEVGGSDFVTEHQLPISKRLIDPGHITLHATGPIHVGSTECSRG